METEKLGAPGKPLSQIEEQVERLNKTLSEQSGIIKELDSRLASVCRISEPCTGNEGVSSDLVPFADHIRQQRHLAENNNSMLTDILGRLEV